jgi:hypothetical protein
VATLLYPNVGSLKIAATIKTFMALAVIKLFKSALTLTPSTTKAQLDAVEANFDGYAPQTVTAWLAPYLDPAGGASIQSGTKQFDYGPAASPPVTNNVFGFWIEDAAGDLIVAGTFTAPVSMAQVGDSIPLSAVLNYGA